MAPIDTDRFGAYAKEADDDAAQYLHGVKESLGQQGITSVDERVIHGQAANAVLGLVEETADCLVTMTSHGRSGIGRWVLGSVADRLARHSGRPVLVIRPTD